MNKNWYAVYTRPRWEKKIAENLTKKGIENYCPLNRVLRQWHDRKKIIHEPLFTCYVFVRVEEAIFSEIKKTEGIINFVYWLRKPALINKSEIETIKKFLNEYSNIQLEKVALNIHDKVKILGGPLMNQEGKVLSINNKLVKVALPSLGYLMIAHVEKQNIQLVGDNISEKYATAL